MDWFKKIFQVFNDNSDVAEEFYEHKRGLPKNITKRNDGSKKMNAKIAYQYPKGTFRFPAIPDEEIPKRAPRQNRKAVNQQVIRENKKIEQAGPAQQVTEPQGHRQKKAVTLKKEPESVLPLKQIKPKKEIRRHGPFRPTEIPSPIYGYERPRNIKVIEHELTGFLHEEELNNQLIGSIHEEATNRIIETSHEDPTNRIIVTKHEDAATDKLPDFSYEDQAQNTLSDLSNDEFFNQDTEVLQELMPVTYEEFAVSQEPSDEVLDKPAQLEIEANFDVNHEDVIEQPNGQVDVEENNLTNDQPRRSTIPFNVLMLKQDRQKLVQQKPFSEKHAVKLEQVTQPTVLPKVEPVAQEKPVLQPEPLILQHEIDLGSYQFPEGNLLLPPVIQEANEDWLQAQEDLLNQTLSDFNVGAKVVNVTQGPSVTRFEVQPDPGVKVNKITNLQDDIKLSLAAKDIRIEAPIPGKHTIGIEVPNHSSRPVLISEILNSSPFRDNPSPLTAALGLDISGNPVVTDLRKMPHGLIAGATGSGKSVCINTILTSLLYKANPNEVKLLLIDPKMVELAPYNHIPHLVSPVITDVKAATAALKWAVEEMERRYELFAHTGAREITRYNEMAEGAKQYAQKLPYILIVIDELADLMMVAPADVEEAVCRIAQKARACGIHLIIATQRPSVDVITGLIKANIPTRIAFSVSSQIDSRTIIDMSGAEKLLGRGDMLFLENGTSKPVRLQGTYISDIEIDKVVDHVRSQSEPEYLFEQTELLKKAQVNEEEDELFYEACEFIIEQGGASTSSLQRRFKIGYNRAARLMDWMEKIEFISEARGSKPSAVLITEEELDSINSSSTIN